MARRNRSNGLELNFDGLADSVTNLVGALILLVVMIIGLSKDAITKAEPPPPERSGKEASDRPMLPLKQRVALLEAEISQMDASISQLHGRLEPLKQEVEELLEKVDSLQPPPKKDEDKPPARVTKEIPYRPPFERIDLNRKEAKFVLEDGRVSFLDMQEVTRQLISKVRKKGSASVKIDVPDSDFRLEGQISEQKAAIKVLRQPGARGESLAEATEANSRFRQKLAQLSRDQVVVVFDVWPDSFEELRGLRQIVWSSQFDYSWYPKKAGEVIELSYGSGGYVAPQ